MLITDMIMVFVIVVPMNGVGGRERIRTRKKKKVVWIQSLTDALAVKVSVSRACTIS